MGRASLPADLAPKNLKIVHKAALTGTIIAAN